MLSKNKNKKQGKRLESANLGIWRQNTFLNKIVIESHISAQIWRRWGIRLGLEIRPCLVISEKARRPRGPGGVGWGSTRSFFLRGNTGPDGVRPWDDFGFYLEWEGKPVKGFEHMCSTSNFDIFKDHLE